MHGCPANKKATCVLPVIYKFIEVISVFKAANAVVHYDETFPICT